MIVQCVARLVIVTWRIRISKMVQMIAFIVVEMRRMIWI